QKSKPNCFYFLSIIVFLAVGDFWIGSFLFHIVIYSFANNIFIDKLCSDLKSISVFFLCIF
ncbi:MAG: hypothetical protein COT55_00040, partial [Candidatus Diapherotrites archaeon CG09_land_8_20_14_0_10_32_12]